MISALIATTMIGFAKPKTDIEQLRENIHTDMIYPTPERVDMKQIELEKQQEKWQEQQRELAQQQAIQNQRAQQAQQMQQVQQQASYTQSYTQPTSSTSRVTFYDPLVASGGHTSIGYNGVAANNSIYPKGTVLKITLSNGQTYIRVVNDMCEAAYWGSTYNTIDIAIPNSQVPSFGSCTATVEVL